MSKKTTAEATTAAVGTLRPKSTFVYGGVNWLVLQNTSGGVLCLAEKPLFEKAFDDDNSNNWEESSLREYLNNEFMEECIAGGAEEAAFLPMALDLTADDGLTDYDVCEDRIGLLSCQQYRKFRGIIPNADGWWWTITPYSTKSNGYSCNVRYVNSDGSLGNSNAFYGSSGVRPLCTLQSSILVSVMNAETSYTPPEGEELENTTEPASEETPAAQLAQPTAEKRKEVAHLFCDCVIAAEKRYLKGEEDLLSLVKAVKELNFMEGGLPF